MTTTVLLERFAYTPHGTFGKLSVGPFECFTVENPVGTNRPFVDCIPEGCYPLVLEHSAKFEKHLWELKNVPGRNETKVHNANTHTEVEGCIGVGKDLGFVNGLWAVTSSRLTLVRFMDAMHGVPDAEILIHFLKR